MSAETTSAAAVTRLAVGQLHCVPGDIAANLALIEGVVRQAAQEGAALVVLPEMATTGYFIADRLPELAEHAGGATQRRLCEIASKAGIHLAVGTVLREGERYFDTQLLIAPDGTLLATYRKTHLFSMEREWFAAGDEPMVVDTAIGRIGMTICYDLLFPEYVRLLVDRGADIVINSTNWMTDDFQHDRWGWGGATVQSLAVTRALENGVWVAMASCVGPERHIESIGHSCIVAPSGKVLASMGSGRGAAFADIQLQSPDLDRWRAIATYRPDRRHDLYRR